MDLYKRTINFLIEWNRIVGSQPYQIFSRLSSGGMPSWSGEKLSVALF